jgi:CheY-like chemotaxis protein
MDPPGVARKPLTDRRTRADESPIRVLIVDDSDAVRTGLGLLLGSREFCEVVGAVDDMVSALERIGTARPHVVLLDFSMPRVDPFALIREISLMSPRPAVLMLSALASEQSTRKAIAAGAVGWVLKDTEPDLLCAALQRAARSAEVDDDSAAADDAVGAAIAHAVDPGAGASDGGKSSDARNVRALLRCMHDVPGGVPADELSRRAVVPLRVAARQLKRLEARRPPLVALVGEGERYVLTAAGEQELERLERHVAGDADEPASGPSVGYAS